MPKKKTATRRALSLGVYHVEMVYSEPGMYPDSARPRHKREARKPARLRMKICMVPTKPKRRTWVEIHFRGPI